MRAVLSGMFAVFLVLVGGGAEAFERPVTPYWTTNVCGGQFESLEAADACVAAYKSTQYGVACAATSQSGPDFDATSKYWFYVYGTSENPSQCSGAYLVQAYLACPGASTPVEGSPGQCECPSGQSWNGSECGAACPTNQGRTGQFFMGWDPGLTGNVTVPGPGVNWNGTYCDGGCNARPNLTAGGIRSCYAYADAATKLYCELELQTDGTSCSGGDTLPTTADASNPCPPGQVQGQVNGVTRCYPSDPNSPTPQPTPSERKKETTVNTVDNGNGTSTTTTTINNGGSTTIITETKDNGTGEVVSKTEVTKNAGDGKGTDGETEMADFCKDNPASPLCRISGWAGSCGSFSCDGDAVQCAQAQASWAMACEMTKESDAKTLGDQIASGSDPAAGTLPNPGNPEQVSLEGLGVGSTSGGWLTRTCPANVSETVWGVQVTLPFESLCGYLEAAGAVMLIIGFLLSARIVGVFS